MNAETADLTQPDLDTSAPPEAPLSIADHAASFGPGAVAVEEPAPPADETPEQKAEREHHSAQQRRDRENGQFRDGKRRTPRNDLHLRVGQLTGELDTANKRIEAAERELAALKAAGATKPQIAAAEAKVERAEAAAPSPKPAATSSTFSEPEPDENDPKFAGDYGKYLRAAAAWEGRKSYFEAREAEREADRKAAAQKAGDERLSKAKERYADFDVVADRVIQRVPQGSALDAWIFQHPKGDDVLYYFDSHPDELDAIIRMPTPLEQFEAVTLLSQRISASPTPGPAAVTTSAAERKSIVLPPKPANVVRTTGAQRASDSPPPTDGSLSIAEHAKHFAKSRR